MSVKLDVTKRIEWLKKRMTISEQDEEYIRLQIMEAMVEALEKGRLLPIDSVSGSFLQNYHYHPENEGTAKTFRNVVTEKWYYESELCDVIGITNVEYLKSNYR